MLNIIADLQNYIVNNLTLYGPLYYDAFGDVDEAMAIRGDPSSATVKEYIDGSCTGSQSISFLARSANYETALGGLDTIKARLHGRELQITDAAFIRTNMVALPVLVSKDESGLSTYSMAVSIEYDDQNPKGVIYG